MLMTLTVSLSVRELVQTCSDSCESTAQKDRATGEKGPSTEPLNTGPMIAEFQPRNPPIPVEILRPQLPLVPVTGVPLSTMGVLLVLFPL